MSTIKIKQVKSRIGAPADQQRTLDALGPVSYTHQMCIRDRSKESGRGSNSGNNGGKNFKRKKNNR